MHPCGLVGGNDLYKWLVNLSTTDRYPHYLDETLAINVLFTLSSISGGGASEFE